MVGERWVPLSDYIVRRAPDSPAVKSDAPAPAAQPVSATAPAGASPIPPGGQSQSAGFVGPGSDKVSLVQSMTTGTSHNPQITTAANWGNAFGGGSPTPPAAAPAAATPVAQPATAPLDTPYGPQLPPTTVPPRAPVDAPPSSPLASVLPAFGSTTGDYDPNQHPGWSPNPKLPGSLGGRATTSGQPTLGFPAMTNPFGEPPAQTSMLPGSMLASAQDLIRRLFPSATG
jgi:hypothetical protein